VAALVAVLAVGCSGSRENPVEGEGRDPLNQQSTTTMEVATTTTITSDDPDVPDGAPTGPIGASGQDQGGSTRGSTVPGAEPGQDADDLQPPGGTFGVDDPGGDGMSDPAPGSGTGGG
jgi:hypothetical protein